MAQESREQTSSAIVYMFGFGFRINPACMHVCWEFGKKAYSVLLAGKKQQKLDCSCLVL